MNSSTTTSIITIRHYLCPGDIGKIILLHSKIYAEEYGYGVSFESYVAAGLAEFYQQYDEHLDRIWIVESGDQLTGCLVAMHRGTSCVQLRYLLLAPALRGLGYGKKLMQEFMDFIRAKQYRQAYLWTAKELHAAAKLYTQQGFKLTEEKHSIAFGAPTIEQKYEWSIS